METTDRPRLVLIPGGDEALGPISRMGLWARFPQTSIRAKWVWVSTKALLLASVAYYFFG